MSSAYKHQQVVLPSGQNRRAYYQKSQDYPFRREGGDRLPRISGAGLSRSCHCLIQQQSRLYVSRHQEKKRCIISGYVALEDLRRECRKLTWLFWAKRDLIPCLRAYGCISSPGEWYSSRAMVVLWNSSDLQRGSLATTVSDHTLQFNPNAIRSCRAYRSSTILGSIMVNLNAQP